MLKFYKSLLLVVISIASIHSMEEKNRCNDYNDLSDNNQFLQKKRYSDKINGKTNDLHYRRIYDLLKKIGLNTAQTDTIINYINNGKSLDEIIENQYLHLINVNQNTITKITKSKALRRNIEEYLYAEPEIDYRKRIYTFLHTKGVRTDCINKIFDTIQKKSVAKILNKKFLTKIGVDKIIVNKLVENNKLKDNMKKYKKYFNEKIIYSKKQKEEDKVELNVINNKANKEQNIDISNNNGSKLNQLNIDTNNQINPSNNITLNNNNIKINKTNKQNNGDNKSNSSTNNNIGNNNNNNNNLLGQNMEIEYNNIHDDFFYNSKYNGEGNYNIFTDNNLLFDDDENNDYLIHEYMQEQNGNLWGNNDLSLFEFKFS